MAHCLNLTGEKRPELTRPELIVRLMLAYFQIIRRKRVKAMTKIKTVQGISGWVPEQYNVLSQVLNTL